VRTGGRQDPKNRHLFQGEKGEVARWERVGGGGEKTEKSTCLRKISKRNHRTQPRYTDWVKRVTPKKSEKAPKTKEKKEDLEEKPESS